MSRLFFSICAAPLLAAQISAPSPGFVRLAGLPIQSLFGVPGNFISAASSFGMAQAASFSDTRGLLAQDGRIRLLARNGSPVASYPYRGSAPLLDLTPDSAIAWLPDQHELLWWTGHSFTAVAISSGDLAGSVSSLSLASPEAAKFLTTQTDGSVSALVVSLTDGRVLSSDLLPGVRGPAFQLGARMIWSDGKALHIDQPGVAPRMLPSPPGPFTAERMSSQWMHLYFSAGHVDCALHLGGNEPTLSRLPALPGVSRP